MTNVTLVHISASDLGDRTTLSAQVPKAPATHEDRTTPRVCFSTSLIGALRGKAGGSDLFGVFAFFAGSNHFYDLIEEVVRNPVVYSPSCAVATKPADVLDFATTDERISLIDVDCVRVGYVDMEALARGEVQMTDARHSRIEGLMSLLGYEDNDRAEAA